MSRPYDSIPKQDWREMSKSKGEIEELTLEEEQERMECLKEMMSVPFIIEY